MTDPVLEARRLSFQYPNAPAAVIDGFNLVLNRGELVALAGRSGCGKSTLLFILGLFLRATTGTVLIHGQRTEALADRERSRLRATDIGFVFQEPTFHTAESIEDNVAEGALYGGMDHHRATLAARKLLERFGLSGIARHRAIEVSGGEAQRASLCRALIRRPSLLLADEPTGNLDDGATQMVLDGLREAAMGGAAVVVVTHSAAVVGACDRVQRLT